MSSYVWGSDLSYQDYLQGKDFVADITRATKEAGHQVSMEISRQTLEIVASQEALAREQIESTRSMQEGFQMLSYGLSEISSGLSELNATFHWGFSEMLAQLGHMNDTLSELVKIAKTPVQTPSTISRSHVMPSGRVFTRKLWKNWIKPYRATTPHRVTSWSGASITCEALSDWVLRNAILLSSIWPRLRKLFYPQPAMPKPTIRRTQVAPFCPQAG